ncbi:RidA family protein [Nonomuraea lactucae]|uniref:RidA family protein n=1 Tax=Nonomuraea lactucae TaxID=2249762 RepID=UPI000DE1D872|nr:RidA family protein [Nonomuraea lactucae]
MTLTRHNPPGLFHPAALNPPGIDLPGGLIAQAVTASGARTVYVSGQVALGPDGAFHGEGDHAAQAARAFANLKTALEAAGARGADVARMTIYVVDHRPELVAPIFAAGLAVFGDDWPVTASALLGVATLGLPHWLIEIDAVAVLP